MKKVQGVPFMRSSFTVRTSPYLHEFKFGDINSALNKNANGHALRMNTTSAIKAALGEHLERVASTKNYSMALDDNNQPHVPGFDLITGEIKNIPAEKVFIEFSLPMFNYKENKHELFNDSCGLAAHIDSERAIEGGFKEFVERQSLVYNWLSRTEGEQIEVSEIKKHYEDNSQLSKIIKIAQIASDEFYCFNISIVEGLYVVLTYGFKGDAFSSGLGTDFSLEKAIEGSLNEYIMILDSSYSLKANDNSYLDKRDVYVYNFHSLSVEEFKNRMSYLLNNKRKLDVKKESSKQIINLKTALLEIKNKYKINIYACFLPFPLDGINVKVVKVFSPEGYPHIWTELFDPEEITITKELPSSKFPNKFMPVPFA
ncbi:YcaO-like family protein [Priestia aryabhattai]|uniref:YcaO-like family protein n=1 Tax=Priestia aryabhattai TaxID=412384 RepID=UPI002E1E9853|nr:YcaO-like family protein [Priestia aryabhattai]